MQQQVLDFWFEELKPAQWFKASAALDTTIRTRFAPLLQQAMRGELESWRNTAEGRLAEIIVLDQFSRNIHRGTPLAFAADPVALVLGQEALRAQALEQLEKVEQRDFLLLPFMHSESALIQQQALPLFKAHTTQGCYRAALQHKAIIDRFGRYPHRNAILGRSSTTEELEFLQQPGSSF